MGHPAGYPDYPLCLQPTTRGNPCKNRAGKNTDHLGTGSCWQHEGTPRDDIGGAPLHNKNALLHGEYETLHASTFDPEERAFYETLNVSPLAQAEANVRLYSIREHRILLRIKKAIQDADASGFEVTRLTTHKGWNVKGKVDFTVAEREAVLTTVQRLDDALNRVQSAKYKAIEQYRMILMDDPPDHDYLGALSSAIDRSAEALGIETPQADH